MSANLFVVTCIFLLVGGIFVFCIYFILRCVSYDEERMDRNRYGYLQSMESLKEWEKFNEDGLK